MRPPPHGCWGDHWHSLRVSAFWREASQADPRLSRSVCSQGTDQRGSGQRVLGVLPPPWLSQLSLMLAGGPKCLCGSLFVGEGSLQGGRGRPHISSTGNLGVASGGSVEPRGKGMWVWSLPLHPLLWDLQRLTTPQTDVQVHMLFSCAPLKHLVG